MLDMFEFCPDIFLSLARKLELTYDVSKSKSNGQPSEYCTSKFHHMGIPASRGFMGEIKTA